MVYLTIIIPVYNETNTIIKILNKIKSVNITKQIIVVDDCSNDGTRQKLIKNKSKLDKLLLHNKNLGKGAAIRTAQKHIKGKFVIIQDADLEYNPYDYKKLIKPLKLNKSKVVYGSRVLGKKRYQTNEFTSSLRVLFNHLLTLLSNMINKQNLTDAHTCYKVFDSKIFKKIKLYENSFAFCPEVTTKISKLNINITEVPISYKGRTYKEGKKISYKDGIEAIITLFKYKYFLN